MKSQLLAGAAMFSLSTELSAFQVVPRSPPISGRIVARKTGETALLRPLATLRSAEVRQDLKAGDILRTNAQGTLAIVFADRTQIRLGRNAVMLVKAVGASGPSVLELQRGSLWGRAPRSGTNLSIETPAANAGIRGTSWAVNVEGGETILQVYEGEIELSNREGTLPVSRGQTARARIGEAPTRLFVVRPSEREQMLFYLPLSDAARYLRPFDGDFANQRATRAKMLSIPPKDRSALNWLELAESGADIDSDSERLAALEWAKIRGLTDTQRARVSLVEAIIMLGRKQWTAATAELDRALPWLDERRRPIALAARRIANGELDTQPPSNSSAASSSAPEMLAEAFAASWRGDLQFALTLSRRGQAQFPEDSDFTDLEAGIALLLGDRTMLMDVVRRGLAKFPDDPGLLDASAELKAEYLGDFRGARSDAERATLIAPGNSSVWNILGVVLLRDHEPKLANAAFKAGASANPGDAYVHANRAVALLDINRIAEAEVELTTALGLDPQQSIAHTYRGRLLIQQGKYQEAIRELLDASATNPTHGQTLLMLAYLYHRAGEEKAAEQQLELAQEYDPLSPFPAAFGAALALDAQEIGKSLQEARAATGAAVKANREDVRADRFLTSALRSSGLDDWARFYSDRYFDPVDAASYFEEASVIRSNPYLVEAGSIERVPESQLQNSGNFHDPPGFIEPGSLPQPPSPPPPDGGPPQPPPPVVPPPVVPPPPPPAFNSAFFTTVPNAGGSTLPLSVGEAMAAPDDYNLSSAMQGLAIDPLAISSSARHSRLFREAFIEFSAEGSAVSANADVQPNVSVSMSGLALAPFPLAFTLTASRQRLRNSLGELQQLRGINAGLGVEFTPNTALIVTYAHSEYSNHFHRVEISDELYRGETRYELTTDRERSINSRADSAVAMITHKAGILRLTGAAGYSPSVNRSIAADDFSAVFDLGWRKYEWEQHSQALRQGNSKLSFYSGNAFFDVSPTALWMGFEHVGHDVSTTLGGGSQSKRGTNSTGRLYLHSRTRLHKLVGEFSVAVRVDNQLEYAAGVRFEPTPDQAFSGSFQSQINSYAPFTLEPRAIVGLLPNAAPTAIGTRSDTMAVRWEREWSPWLFTVAEVQHQRHDQLVAPAEGAFLSTVRSSPYSIDPQYVLVGRGTVDRLSVTANALLAPKLALDITGTITDSRKHNYLPAHYAHAGLVWTATRQIKASVGSTFIASRFSDSIHQERSLGQAAVFDASIAWRSRDRRIEAALKLYNAFDSAVEVYDGFPRYGRAVVARAETHF